MKAYNAHALLNVFHNADKIQDLFVRLNWQGSAMFADMFSYGATYCANGCAELCDIAMFLKYNDPFQCIK
jgi:hypothetical protein